MLSCVEALRPDIIKNNTMDLSQEIIWNLNEVSSYLGMDRDASNEEVVQALIVEYSNTVDGLHVDQCGRIEYNRELRE